MSISDFNLKLPLPDIFPEEWKETISHFSFMSFRNLDHFKHEVAMITQENDTYCGIKYSEALSQLMKGESNFPEVEQASIRNLVRSKLQKRGLITEEVYEHYRYSVDGTAVGYDIGKYANGEADCVITPTREYIDFFYELYINISYPYTVPNKQVRESVAKLLATIEELERQHIYIKITMVLPIRNVYESDGEGPEFKPNFFSTVPLFSHKDKKSVSTMSSVVNDRLLRKFYFAVLENLYGKQLAGGYGHPVTLPKCMNIGEEFDEIKFFKDVLHIVGADK